MKKLIQNSLRLAIILALAGTQIAWAEKGKPKNNPPVAEDDAATVVQGNTVVIPVLENDSDPEGDPLTVQNVRRAKGVVRIQDDGTLLYRPTPNFLGEDVFEYTITDGKKGKASARVRVQVRAAQANQDPVAVDDAAITDEDTPVTITVLSNDSDPDGDALSVASVTQGANGSVSTIDNTVTYTPDENFNGSDSFTYTVSDGQGGSATASVNITVNAVNDDPVAVDDAYSVAEDNTLTVNAAAGILDNDSDVDGDPLAVTLLGDGTANGSLTLNANGSFTYTPDAGYFGSDGFDYMVSDNNGGTATASVSLSIGSVNDPPVADDQSVTTDEDLARDITLTGSDPDANVLTFAITAHPSHGSLSGTAPNLTYLPEADFNGADSFTFTVNDGYVNSAAATVAITVNPVNDAPVARHDDAVTGMRTPVTINILANDYDVDGDVLTVKNVEQANGVVDINADGSLLYTPTPNFTGLDDFVYRLEDGNGGVAMGSVTVLVDFENNAPVAEGQSVTTAEDEAKAITLSGSDPDGDAITYAYAQPDHGTLSGDAPDLTYSPDQDFNGVDEFTFSVTDPYGATGSATVSITVSPVNDPPVITSPATAEATEDEPFTYTATATDADNPSIDITISNLSGWLTADGSTVSGTPSEGVTAGSFTITADDGELTAVLDVTVTVGQVNDPPVAVDDEADTDEDTPVTINVLANDTDEDGDVLSVTSASVTDPAHGTVQDNQDGTITYTPDAGFSGSDSFTYTASDGELVSDPATVTILVNLAGDLAADEPVDPNEGGTVTTDIGVSIEIPPQDPPGETVNIQIGTYEVLPPGAPQLMGTLYFFGPSGTTFDPPATITVPYNPDLLPGGYDPADLVLLIYNESDGIWTEALNSTVDTDAETVTGQTYHFSGFAAGLLLSRPPYSLGLPGVSIDEDAQATTIIQDLTDYFADPNFGDQINFAVESLDPGRLHALFISQDLSLIVEPRPNFNGEVRIVITATDLTGLWVSDTLYLTVTPDNDPPFFLATVADAYTISEDQLLRIHLSADDVEGDDVTFHAASDTSAVTTLVQDTTLLVAPIQDWFGTAHIIVSASDGQDTTHLDPFTLTIEAVNDPPSEFELLTPDVGATIQIETGNLDDFLTFTWEEVIDPDDSVNYSFTLSDTGAIYFEYDTTITATEVRVSYADIVSAIRDQGLTNATFWWTIMAVSGQDTVRASNGSYGLTIDISTLAVMDENHLPQFFALHQNYPNPFNPVTTLRYELPVYCQVLLVIYDMRGREVIRLVDGYESSGYNKVVWNSGDAFGRPVPSGIYFARLITPEYTHVIKMSLIR